LWRVIYFWIVDTIYLPEVVISKSGRGRPSRGYILNQVDLGMRDLERLGGLPSPTENAEIWRDIWYEESHNSTAIEGNTLILRQVKTLLAENRPVGNKELQEYLEVRAYAQAAEWVYEHGRSPGEWTGGAPITLTELRHIHRLTVGPVWEFFPPDGFDADEGPGSFRRHDVAMFIGGMAPPPFAEVAPAVSDWIDRTEVLSAPPGHTIVELARLHADLERIHPFRDGNGRVGRLVLNLLLIRRGYPPAVIRNRDRERYLRALRRADAGDPLPLAELIARAVKDGLDRFLLPNLAGPVKLLPLSALTTPALNARALRAAADRGGLRAVKDESGRWLSSKRWVADYASRRRRGRPPKNAGGVR
jgi:fido (protein-threonine AMPylation protein)